MSCVAAGGLWTGQRLASEGYPVLTQCPLPGCGDSDDLWHRYWGSCEPRGIANLPEVMDTDYLRVQAEAGRHLHPCLWMRGIIPQDLLPNIEPPPGHHRLVSAGALQGLNLDQENIFSSQDLKFYVDESGAGMPLSLC